MQLFPRATSPAKSRRAAAECARLVLDTIPLAMQAVRETMRARRADDLTVPQFRTLAMLYFHPGASLSHLAEHLGLGLPSASKLADGLVGKNLLTRVASADDRRRLELRVTPAGRRCFEGIHRQAQACLAGHLATLSDADAQTITAAMHLLKEHLSPRTPARPHAARPRRGKHDRKPESRP